MSTKTAAEKRRKIIESEWRDNFKRHALNVGFRIGLSRAMCEFLSAVADDVHWNRAMLGAASADPDNWIATGTSLASRGLITRKPQTEIERHDYGINMKTYFQWSHWVLTPAGEHVVELLKLTGIYVPQDAAVLKQIKG